MHRCDIWNRRLNIYLFIQLKYNKIVKEKKKMHYKLVYDIILNFNKGQIDAERTV